jgi:hypothetical protein
MIHLMAQATLQAGDLMAEVGDNGAAGEHRAGYNGVWNLRHKKSSRNLFVPSYAGLNHEHIFNGETEDDPEYFFEPRRAPMTFKKVSDMEAELHQPPTPTFHLESWTQFRLVTPHYLDMRYRCVAHQHVFHRGWIGLFWASYINAPDDKSIYFLGGMEGETSAWTQLCTQRHNDESTVRHRDDKLTLEFANPAKPALFKSLSPSRFDLPFFYGLFDDLTWIVMFDRTAGIRITHSPSGGGGAPDRRTTNPAWDFQYLIPDYEVARTYELRVRTVLRPRCSRDEVLKEYNSWVRP